MVTTCSSARPLLAAHARQSRRCVAQSNSAAPERRRKLVGLGSACVDLLAAVAQYPAPDSKVRSESFTSAFGGNTANTLVTAARLGRSPVALWTKLADDAYGAAICADLEREGVSAESVVRAAEGASPFTYILVDLAAKTRTCIHTPGPATVAADLTEVAVRTLLKDAACVAFDGRLSEPALVLAREAMRQGIPCLVEAERPRAGLDELLQLATFVSTSTHFPTDWTGHTELADALIATLERLPRAQLLVTTLGAQGSVALQRCSPDKQRLDAAQLGSALAHLHDSAAQNTPPNPALHALPTPRDPFCSPDMCGVRVLYQPASAAHPDDIVDTTGAGDAFIGALAYALIEQMPLERALKLASWVAATKCRAIGPRAGLPRREEVPPELL